VYTIRFVTLPRLIVLLAVAAASLCGRPLHAQDDSGGTLRPGDVLRVTVLRKPELTAEMEVAADGTLLHPLYREIRVAGLSSAELEEALRTFLLRYEAEPRFMHEHLVRVTVGGEVRAPKVFTVRPSVTTFQAVVEAGGSTERGRLDRVVLFRDGTARTLDLSRADSPDGAIPVRSGDLLVVQRRGTGVREWLPVVASTAAALAAMINLALR